MATIGSLTAINGTPDDYAVIENGNGNFKEKALFIIERSADIIPGGAGSTVTIDEILVAYYNYIRTNYGDRPGVYVFSQGWAGRTSGLHLTINFSMYQGNYPHMWGEAFTITEGVYAFEICPTSATDFTPVVYKAHLANSLA